MQTKFIHFGCWNQKFCDKGEKIGNDNPISKVMRQLDKTVQKAKETGSPHDFIVVAGDNYYPEKDKDKKKDKGEKSAKAEKSEKTDTEGAKTEKSEKKKDKIKGKTIIQANLESGFNCLPDNIEVNIILGNHDLETTGNGKQLFIENTDNPEEEGDCKIMQLEKANVERKRYTLDLHKHKWLGDNTLVLMIDTSMYDEEDAESFLPCYNKFNDDKAGKKTIADYIAEQQEFVDRTIEKYAGKIKNIIVIGHHPMSGYKYKGQGIMVIKSFPGLIKLFLSIKTMLPPDVNYYYLCADLHSYQIGTININTDSKEPVMKIKQYIVGTGGTELDPSPFEKMKKDPSLTLPDEPCYIDKSLICSYEMTPEQIELATSEKHGFLECELKKSKMYFKFIDTHGIKYIERNNSSGTRRASIGGRRGKKRKTRKTRKIRKYKKY